MIAWFSPAIQLRIIVPGFTQERQSFGRRETWLLSYMHYDVWWLYHFRRENSFRTFYRRYSGFIFGTRNNFVSWLLNFGCAQDDTQGVEQEGRTSTRARVYLLLQYRLFRMTKFQKPRYTSAACICASLRRRVKKFRFLADTKKAAPKMRATREKTRAANYARIPPRAPSHTTDSAQRGDKHRSRCSTPTHTRVHLHIHTLAHAQLHVYT